jgi:hypothetical protein
MKKLLELIAKIKTLKNINYCKLKLNLHGIINYTCIEHIPKNIT